MSNAMTVLPTYHANLPAFLKSADLFAAASGLTGGISGGQPPTIAFSGKSFKLRDANGDEIAVNQMHLDVIVVGGNRHVSKAYYGDENGPFKYDPKDTSPPVCWSDNGQAPSSQSSSPQAASCGACKWAAFGSRVSDTGSMVKACGDAKKLAVVLAAPTEGVINNARQVVEPFQQVYLLKLPAMSMRPWKDFAEDVERHGWPVKSGIVLRLSFDPAVTYPKVAFASVTLVTEALYGQFSRFVEGDEAKAAVGASDLPFAPAASASASVPPVPATTPLTIVPSVTAPASTTSLIPLETTAAAATAAPAQRQKGRRSNAAPPAALPQATPPQAASPAPSAFPIAAAAAPLTGNGIGVIAQPVLSSAALDQTLDQLFNGA